jgi:hypothetical protein
VTGEWIFSIFPFWRHNGCKPHRPRKSARGTARGAVYAEGFRQRRKKSKYCIKSLYLIGRSVILHGTNELR